MPEPHPRPILFAAGGSGGHLFPAMAVADELRRRRPDRLTMIVASDKAIDRTILADSPHSPLHLPAIAPSKIWQQPIAVVRGSWQAYRAATQLVSEHSPAVVVGCGGFASAPLVCAAIRAKVPVVLLEQNVVPGRATVWFSRWARTICLSFEETRAFLPRAVQQRGPDSLPVTGTPVRAEFIERFRESSRDSPSPPLPGGAGSRSQSPPPLLVILGGSQGSSHLNESFFIWAMTHPPELRGWRVVHQTGMDDHPALARRAVALAGFIDYEAVSFLASPAELYRGASLIVGRAGATSLAELACLGIPAVLLPLPTAARDHQTANARWYADRGAALMATQRATPVETSGEWQRLLPPLLCQSEQREKLSQSMRATGRSSAGQQIANIIESIAKLA